MNINQIFEWLKFLDCFGTTYSFYTEKNRKFYTAFGGILTIISIIFGILVFIYINLDNFSYNLPISTISTSKEKYKNITFREEKIWIPWRIRDFGGKTINHKGLLFPIIFYLKGVRNNDKEIKLSYEVLNYKLCNETSMVNSSYLIDMKLDDLYCIDMEDLYMGGNWDTDFLNFVQFDLYMCKNGIDYDKDNKNCTSYEQIVEMTGKYNCFDFEIYYQ